MGAATSSHFCHGRRVDRYRSNTVPGVNSDDGRDLAISELQVRWAVCSVCPAAADKQAVPSNNFSGSLADLLRATRLKPLCVDHYEIEHQTRQAQRARRSAARPGGGCETSGGVVAAGPHRQPLKGPPMTKDASPLWTATNNPCNGRESLSPRPASPIPRRSSFLSKYVVAGSAKGSSHYGSSGRPRQKSDSVAETASAILKMRRLDDCSGSETGENRIYEHDGRFVTKLPDLAERINAMSKTLLEAPKVITAGPSELVPKISQQ